MHNTPIWSRIGTKLYLALAFAVALTILSAAVGIYHFEQSGDLNYRVQNAALPLLEDTRSAANATIQIVQIGHDLQAEATASQADSTTASHLGDALRLLEQSLARPAGHEGLRETATYVHEAAAATALDIDQIETERIYAAETAERRIAAETFLNKQQWTPLTSARRIGHAPSSRRHKFAAAGPTLGPVRDHRPTARSGPDDAQLR